MRTIRDEDDDGQETAEFEDVKAIAKGPVSLLCVFPDGEQHWVPDTQMHDNSEITAVGDTGRLVVRMWWAKKVGLV